MQQSGRFRQPLLRLRKLQRLGNKAGILGNPQAVAPLQLQQGVQTTVLIANRLA